MKKKIVGIDLGTSSTLIWLSSTDSIAFNEPSVLAWRKEDKSVFETGYLAHKLIGKTPEGMEIVFPVKNGVIADVEAATVFLQKAFANLHASKEIKGASLIVDVPSDITNVEKDALVQVSYNLGVKELFIVEAAKASAIGSGIDVFSTRGNMIVDIGGSRTNMAALAMGQVIVSKTCDFAGQSVDDSIIRFVRTKHHLLIGPKTAEYIKMKIGTLLDTYDNNLLEVSGKDALSSLPHSVIVSTAEIADVIQKIYSEISNVIVDTLEVAPSEVSSDIIHTGITLSGGGCLLTGAREFFSKQLSVPVHVSPYPLESTIQGIRKGAEDILKGKPEFTR
jgi:rod shape-determining protein MreB